MPGTLMVVGSWGRSRWRAARALQETPRCRRGARAPASSEALQGLVGSLKATPGVAMTTRGITEHWSIRQNPVL